MTQHQPLDLDAIEPSTPPACPVLHCPWQPSEDNDLEGHLYDAHSARQLAAALTSTVASFEAQAAIASGLLTELAERRGQVLTEAAEAVAAYTGNPIDANAQMLRRLAARTTQES